MTTSLAIHEIVGKVSYVTLNRAQKLNAVNPELMEQATAALLTADADTNTTVVVLRGAGRSFCAGYDVAGELDGDLSWRDDPLIWRDYLHRCLEFEMTPMNMRKPVIASVRGYAVGGGCELMMFCDLTICADDAKFGEPEVRFSNPGPAMIMPFIIGHRRARELLFMGDMIDAQTALECNLVNRVVPVDQLEQATTAYANRLALIDPEALFGTKLALRRGLEATGLPAALRAGTDVLAPVYAAKTESGAKFMQLTAAEGLGSALKWRMSQFDEPKEK